jgi:hypothetical protein
MTDCDRETQLQNTASRIDEIGPGAEVVRRIHVDLLRTYMDAFYEHDALADILWLCVAFDAMERKYCGSASTDRARLVEAILGIWSSAEHPGLSNMSSVASSFRSDH